MKKITELKETLTRTVREKDALGNRSTKQVPFTAFRRVNVATNGIRFAHLFIDSIIYYYIYELVVLIAGLFVDVNVNPVAAIILIYNISLISFFSFPLYYIVFEHFFQKTPAKFLTKTRVIDIYGNKPELGTNILRNIIRLVPFEIFSCLSERGWHDRWSETFVVKDEEYNKIKELLNNETNSTSL